MTHAPTHFCHLGAIGWDHSEWTGAFYPEDLPPEWRLAFYNTHFDCVFLPYPLWAREAPATLAAWRDDTLERFRFLLEHPPGAPGRDDVARLATLSDRAVLLGREECAWLLWFDGTDELRALAARLEEEARRAVAQSHPLYLVSRDGDLGRLLEVQSLLEVLGY